jgi:serine/threonine-protein kinase RsbT
MSLVQISVEIVDVTTEADIIRARVKAKVLAESLGFDYMDQTRISTAVSELARNAFQYAGGGRITIKAATNQARRGIEIIAEDHGPGIENLELAVKGGYSTGTGLGMGLSGTKRLMDEFDIQTTIGKGTVITIKKWL